MIITMGYGVNQGIITLGYGVLTKVIAIVKEFARFIDTMLLEISYDEYRPYKGDI